tara:strand:+ start:8658 stop:9698 length:1041 start_codon:yes stop_codon:yes gene_type:complete
MIAKGHPLYVNKKLWKEFSEEEMNNFVTNIFNHYRANTFPYFKVTSEEVDKVVKKMVEFDTSTLLQEGDTLKQVMLGLNVVNYFMPHMFEVKCNNFKSPMECFENDEMFKKAIRKRITMGDNMSDAGMRKALSWTSGTQKVSNFRPTIAKYIYDNYSGDGNVLDFSAGFGGRLLGATSSDMVKKYTGVDPSNKTFYQLCELAEEISEYNENTPYISMRNNAIEDCTFGDGEFNLAFSSPPYFNTEEYAYEDNQSFVRYTEAESWRDNFLVPLIDNCYRWVKDDGHFIINIANVRTYKTLEEDTVRLAKERGFKLVKTYRMALSSLMGKGFKYEPIFVFKKEKNENN